MQNTTSVLPLRRYRVIDFGTALAGGQPGQMLADMGAEVIKVESRQHLDGFRLGNPGKGVTDPEERRPSFHSLGRNKLDITVDITQPKAQDVIGRLVTQSDVVFENFTPGVLARAGLDYPSLRRFNPQLVMVSLSSAGQRGPLSSIVVYAPAMSALAGADSVMGYRDGPLAGLRSGYGDATAAAYAVVAVLTALLHRNRTGQGQYIDLSAWEATATVLGQAFLEYVLTRRVPQPRGNWHPNMAPHGNYRCKGDDRWVAIAVGSDGEWRSLCRVLGDPEWARDPRFATSDQRVLHAQALDEQLSQWTLNHTPQEAAQMLQKAGVAATAVITYAEQYEDPHFKARHTYERLDHPLLPGEVVSGIPWKFSRTPGSLRRHAPFVGEHNGYIFSSLLGFTDLEFQEMAREGVIR
ncbi:MAG: CoA transferase [Dehalococcoidia bacterium]|nr:CoA transferase [Dehalococcoidia bacterium]